MRNLDRILVLVLAVGVWALVLRPASITAHSNNYHTCYISGSAEGYNYSGRFVEVDDWGGVTVECDH